MLEGFKQGILLLFLTCGCITPAHDSSQTKQGASTPPAGASDSSSMTILKPGDNSILLQRRHCDPQLVKERYNKEAKPQVEIGIQRFTEEPVEPPEGQLYLSGGCP
jgi:hypothetical protein